MEPRPHLFKETAREEVAKKEQSDFLVMVSGVFNYLCDTAMNDYGNYDSQEEARNKAKLIRENSLAALPELLEEFEKNATRNGVKVLWAENAEEACSLVEQLAEKHQVKVITKGKSMLSEEIGLNQYLEEKSGVKIFEGDLGELIVQMRGTAPFHIVGPAINLSVQEIASILEEHTQMPYTEAADEIAAYVRGFLRGQFEKADMGITGVNQAVAATGSILLMENEGNIRWSTSAPRVHVALMSIEKVSASLEDAMHLLGLLSRNCTGQAMTSYVSVINGPRIASDKDGPEDMYVIIIDNGRSHAYKHPLFREALRCIRCGRCGIKCPVYLRIGAYPYGWSYPGPMGTVLMPLLLGMDKTRDLYEACTLCGACQEICPAGVPHLSLYEQYRQMKAEGDSDFGAHPVSGAEKMSFNTWAWACNHSSIYNNGVKIVQKYMRQKSEKGYISNLPGPLKGWFECRDIQGPPQMSFRQRWNRGLKNEAEIFVRQTGAVQNDKEDDDEK